MIYINISKIKKICLFIKTVGTENRSFLSLFGLILLMFFLSTALIVFFSFHGKLYGEENTQSINSHNGSPNLTKVPFILPLDGETVLGFREEYFYNEKNTARKHTGIDIRGDFNQSVFSSGDGVVSYIGFSPTGGRTIVIRHNENIRTTYLNLLSIFVSNGDYVNQGEVIGTVGGNDDPSYLADSHLHFGIIYNGFYLDPQDVLKISYKNITSFISIKYLENDFYLK